MSSIDQFESVFRSAVNPTYEPRPFPLQSVLLLSDLDDDAEREYLGDVERFFSGLASPPKITSLPKEQSVQIPELVRQVSELGPDLIVTHRHLHNEVAEHTYTLGDHIEVLTQVTDSPILLFPHSNAWPRERFIAPSRVLVLTDHLTEHPQLVDAALAMLRTPGQLTLAHVEDESVFERYIHHISKIPEIDTEIARQLLEAKLLGEARRFIELTEAELKRQSLSVQVHAEVKMGHRLQSYVDLVKEHHIELVVMQTKDQDQVAMHGLSYPLSVELQHTPLLML